MTTPEPFTIDIPDAALDDLHQRLAATRWADDFANDDWRYGTNGAYLRELVAYWQDGYDWRAQEAEINRFHHYRLTIDEVPVHFIHEPGQGPNPVPIILSHGWPLVFWDYKDVIGPLTNPAAYGGDPLDAFDVIVPSLPGYGFSTPLTKPGVNFSVTADLWRKLMVEVLGFDRFAASGIDWGALVTGQLGHKYAEDMVGIHTCGYIPLTLLSHEKAWDFADPEFHSMTAEDQANQLKFLRKISSHLAVHILDPQTLAFGLNDSPVGLLSWLLERRRLWGDTGGDVETAFTKDHLLTTTMLYWLTESLGSSIRYYAEAANDPWTPSHNGIPVIQAPHGISFFGGDIGGGRRMPVEALEAATNLRFINEHDHGGHFAPVEVPDLVVEDIRATFRGLR
ncbi:MAG: epoxide hydrolase family protein [Alphaproteobacteria bacterium]